MSNALLTMPAVAADDGIEADHHNNVAANVRSLSRNFWDAGTPDLALSEQKQGASWMDPTTLAMWIFRIDGAGDPRDAGSPLRPTWHWNDFDGAPPDDGRAAEGDCLIWDSGSGDTYVLHRDAARFRGLGVLAEYRTAATATSGATQNQASDRVTMRASRWDTSGTPAAKYREWSFYAHTASSAGDSYSLLHIDRRHEGGAWTGVATLDTNGWLYLTGAVPGIELNSGGAGNAYIRATATDPDGSVFQFAHGNSSRWARFRFLGTTTGTTGTAAEALSVSFGSDASGGTTTKNSAAFLWRGSYWDGAAAQVASFYSQHILDAATPAGHLRIGSYGSGTLDLYDDGGCKLTQNPAGSSSPAGQFQLDTTVAATSGAKTSPGGAFVSIGYSWDGAASQPRVMGWYTNVDDPADAGDVWSHRLIAVGGGSPTDVLFATSQGWLGIGATPAVAGHITETTTITGGVTDGYTAGLRIQPTYTAATAQTVTRHNYLDAKNPTLSGAGPAALTDACLVHFDAAAGTHKAVDASSTKTTPGGVDAWVKVNINGTIHYMPAYLSKTA